MLHLAQIQKNPTSDDLELHLLAVQTADEAWEPESRGAIALSEPVDWAIPHPGEGILVLVDLDENYRVLALKDATDWIVELIQKSLPSGGGDLFSLEDEEARIEQWRQELTSQSQDITRRNLEIETRREQIQALKAAIEQEKEQLELRWQELKDRERQDNS